MLLGVLFSSGYQPELSTYLMQERFEYPAYSPKHLPLSTGQGLTAPALSRPIKASFYLVTHTDQDITNILIGKGLAGKERRAGEKKGIACGVRSDPRPSSKSTQGKAPEPH